MTSRLAEPDPRSFTADERAVYDVVTSGPHNPTGPTAIWSRSPRLAQAALDFGNYVRFGSVLEPRLRELAILVTAVEWRCENEWLAHEPLARKAGLSEEAVAGVRDGAFASQDAAERAVHDVAVCLHRDRDIPDDVYERASRVLGDRGMVELISTVGFYTMIAMLLNGTRAPITRRDDKDTRPDPQEVSKP
ncbi:MULTISPECIES: carboxymuconolactone decarboxylase family protein [unclassified Microbispora]|uniref:carboxymuconolactone decarboxylase family protein n=1 Tax=unclassified Microbispora TaxID=2614687 RepID=UPI001474EF68|nr:MULTISPECIES: carboxymuconolactone decarboxylase family protein [unclassified Microbispora]